MFSWLLFRCSRPLGFSDGELLVGDDRRRPEVAAADSEVLKALRAMQVNYPFLAQPTHHLFQWVKACEEAVKAGDVEKAKDHLARIEQEVEQEEKALRVAFRLFATPGSENLTGKEVKVMLEYLGFPAHDEDVETLLTAADKDGDKTMSLTEFQLYVGRMGGSYKLFEIRRKRMAEKHGGRSETSAATAGVMVAEALKEAGILEQEQAYWNLVLPRAPEEFIEASKLTECQKVAVRDIRVLARTNHERALPDLQRKVQTLKYTDNDLWMALAYIRELAPIIVHVDLSKVMTFMEKDTHYRNQFETRSSGGLLKPETREKWERGLFGTAYDNATGFERPKYGVLNAMNDYKGVVKCRQYGDSYLVLKDVRLRCTFSPEDSANLKSDRLAVIDYYGHVLNEYSNNELEETIKIAKSSEAAVLGDSSKVGNMKYKETQVHGEISFDKHVERLVADIRHRKADAERLKAICKRHGWKFSWMDEERERMRKEDLSTLGEEAWKEKLQAIMDKGTPDVKGVPPGFCKKGCGRRVQPGKTASGNDFTTCCRGCALGFGHNLICGNIDPELVGPGKCVHGCGKPKRQGTTVSGRPFTTCCKGCEVGVHDLTCGTVVEDGLCKFNCGRRASPGTPSGRKFDTCCRTCARTGGRTHDDSCLA